MLITLAACSISCVVLLMLELRTHTRTPENSQTFDGLGQKPVHSLICSILDVHLLPPHYQTIIGHQTSTVVVMFVASVA